VLSLWLTGRSGPSAVGMETSPIQVSGATGIEPIVELRAGRDHTLAIGDDGSLWLWGGNDGGQIGNNTKTDQGTPIELALGGAVTDAAGGAFHSIASMADGTVRTWGRNAFGQLGISSNVFNVLTPQTISSISTATSIGSGRDHSLVTLADGSALAFGRNDKGQLGDGTLVDRNSPVAMLGIGNAPVVEGGRAHSRVLTTMGGNSSDTTPPTGAWVSPSTNQAVSLPVTLQGSAADNVGVDHVEMIIRDLSTGSFWNPTDGTWGGFDFGRRRQRKHRGSESQLQRDDLQRHDHTNCGMDRTGQQLFRTRSNFAGRYGRGQHRS